MRVVTGEAVLARRGYLAGPDAARGADLQRMLDDPDVRAVFCARGGFGSQRIVPTLDLDDAAAPAEAGRRLQRRHRAPDRAGARRRRGRARADGRRRPRPRADGPVARAPGPRSRRSRLPLGSGGAGRDPSRTRDRQIARRHALRAGRRLSGRPTRRSSTGRSCSSRTFTSGPIASIACSPSSGSPASSIARPASSSAPWKRAARSTA